MSTALVGGVFLVRPPPLDRPPLHTRHAPRLCLLEKKGRTPGLGPRPVRLLSHSFLGGYSRRSLKCPFFLASPFLWSDIPSTFLASSPVRAPVPSLGRPLALCTAPSTLSPLRLFSLSSLTLPADSRMRLRCSSTIIIHEAEPEWVESVSRDMVRSMRALHLWRRVIPDPRRGSSTE